MFEIDEKVIPLKAENDGCRSYYKVVGKDGEFIDVVNLNLLGRSTPRRCLASDFVTLAEWERMKNERKAGAAVDGNADTPGDTDEAQAEMRQGR